jgi:hypothetical protein
MEPSSIGSSLIELFENAEWLRGLHQPTGPRYAACTNQASRTGHSWVPPHAGHRARTIRERMRNKVMISVVMPISICWPVFGQANRSFSMSKALHLVRLAR